MFGPAKKELRQHYSNVCPSPANVFEMRRFDLMCPSTTILIPAYGSIPPSSLCSGFANALPDLQLHPGRDASPPHFLSVSGLSAGPLVCCNFRTSLPCSMVMQAVWGWSLPKLFCSAQTDWSHAPIQSITEQHDVLACVAIVSIKLYAPRINYQSQPVRKLA